jgi:hypothetical protein
MARGSIFDAAIELPRVIVRVGPVSGASHEYAVSERL